MSMPRPHSPADLALAPVLIELERNLARLRASDDLELALALDLNDEDWFYHGPAERAGRLEKFATREVDLHGWSVTPTTDLYGLAVEHGEYAVSLMFGERLVDYVQNGPEPQDD
ncbi:MAG TPA: hypothetical protein VME19_09480 [Streptosporangiaceae bacterium]|nr:hypothetical protein [Streptosporangiaceae bacterium]